MPEMNMTNMTRTWTVQFTGWVRGDMQLDTPHHVIEQRWIVPKRASHKDSPRNSGSQAVM